MSLNTPEIYEMNWLLPKRNKERRSVMCIFIWHYSDVIKSAIASQITDISIAYSTVCSGADQRKHQSSASLTFVSWIHRWPANFPHKGPVTREMLLFDDVIMLESYPLLLLSDFILCCYCRTLSSAVIVGLYPLLLLLASLRQLQVTHITAIAALWPNWPIQPLDNMEIISCSGPIMTSSNGNIFRVTGPLCGEFIGHRWNPSTKASDAGLWCFPWSAPE